ncbi:glutathione peroxidase, putative [Schistosoma mansoni]|uniref:glutathione peroxidase, putative n=1 Tax=Schistosoma mansoni TaxID=6183 RepID=UPI00022C86E5|nr:glutathione peroxidase, putative [Schistosoma mansoni]|eukprot:XP_018645848.1 glutathione peroxidase, putative [Schistosoma mansoni]
MVRCGPSNFFLKSSSHKSWNSIYEFTVKDINGVDVSLEKYRGATDKNYRQLQEMHTRLVGKGLRILAFPCNEPWAEAEIKKFVTEKYGVQFDMFSKIKVNGSDADDLYKFLKSRQHGTLTNNIKWNFSKFLVDRQGQPVKRYSPTTAPYVSC